ncbi:hypothetical protein MF271_24520 (plasmid) [Deinococcus sp. KNUC1210]|nr:transposase family protein [Deinococcus sp. KNUC1210]ULH18373.1 hypothetical protein MF271_24520 [Deinococcus sp. KNUC1210]
MADAGYQGSEHEPTSTWTPKKAYKLHSLTDTQRAANRRLPEGRLPVEQVIQRLNVFCILKETYRHQRHRFHLRVKLIATLCNRVPNST